MGLGQGSIRKSYYPELQKKIDELDREKNFVNDIINSMPSLLISLDGEGRITRLNKSAQEQLETTEDEAVGEPVESLIDYISEELKDFYSSKEKKTNISGVRKTLRKGNTLIHQEIAIYSLSDKESGNVVLKIDDITDRVRLQETVVQTEKMLSIGGLAAGMAHEINNPLAGIMQTAVVMRKRLTDMDLESNRSAAEKAGIKMEDLSVYLEDRGIIRMLNGISESGRRASFIVQNMLSFSRRDEDPFSSHDPVSLMEKILELASTDFSLHKKYDFRNIEIVKEYEEDLPLLPCSRSQLQQVILNLLRNGAEAMGEINESGYKPRFIIRIRTDNEMLFFDIEDNGPGMSMDNRKRVFEPFFTTKPVGVGTGLGLSVSYFIITENHKGTLKVDSVPGEGACFTIGLPLHV